MFNVNEPAIGTQSVRPARIAPRAIALLPLMLFVSCLLARAGEVVPPPGGTACEIDWLNRGRFETLPSELHLRQMEAAAEAGNLWAHLRLGRVQKTSDGKWQAPQDRSYNVKWLFKAIEKGSKSAEWELARIELDQKKRTHESYLRAAIAAADADRNPWAASELMDLTNGRWGRHALPTACDVPSMVDGKCAPAELLQVSSARRWAEIAAEGGNAAAQEWLCSAAVHGAAERGQPKDGAAALKWCALASHNACSLFSLADLEAISRDPGEIARLRQAQKQPWRGRLMWFLQGNQRRDGEKEE